MTTTNNSMEADELLDKLEVFQIRGRDKQGRKILRVIGKHFPAREVGEEALRGYLERRVYGELEGKQFSVVYVHTGVQRGENWPGVGALRALHDALPAGLPAGLHAVYFIHPGLQARLFLATLGRLLFSSWLYGKVKYVSRLEFLWEHVRRGEVEVPDFVHDHDDELEHRPLMDYGLETDHQRLYDAPAMDSAASMQSLRCIS